MDARYPEPARADGLIVLADELTPFVDVELAGGTIAAHRFLFGSDPSFDMVCALLAQMKLETGNGRYCHRRNVGNVKAQPSYRGHCTYFRCNEVERGKVVWYDPFNPACCFRAFLDWASGLEQHLRFLGLATTASGRANRYARAWEAARRGDVVGFVTELHAAGYFTAALAPYVVACVQIFDKLQRELPRSVDVPDHEHDPSTLHPTVGHSPFSDTDLARVQALHFDLKVDWGAWREERDGMIHEAGWEAA